MAVLVSARDLAAMGSMGKLYWDPKTVTSLPPLGEIRSRELFDEAAYRFGLGAEPDFESFRERTLSDTQGNPGQIIEMCRLAADLRYRTGGFLHYSLIRIDTTAFVPFIGIGPCRHFDLFSVTLSSGYSVERKHDSKLKNWSRSATTAPRLQLQPSSYLNREILTWKSLKTILSKEETAS